MQSNGNLVIYNGNGQPIKWSNTWGHSHFLQIQDDGDLVIYGFDLGENFGKMSLVTCADLYCSSDKWQVIESTNIPVFG
jgi:hypothetical protein